MEFDEELSAFVRTTFRSVWSLELLLHLIRHADRSWSRDELVESMRSSDLIVTQSIDLLIAAGLISVDSDGCARYAPASQEISTLALATRDQYARSPNAVRRLIISGASGGLAAFADAFRLRKD